MRMRGGVAVGVCAALLLGGAGRVAAEVDGERPSAAEPPTELKWYGLPMVASDVASDAALFLLPAAGLAGMTLGGPIVHWSRGHVATGFGSLALRTGADLVSLLIWASALECDSCSRTHLLPVLIPLVAVQALDAGALSWETVAAPGESLAKHRGLDLRIGPTIAMLHSGGAIGVVGAF
jgi:hypothetical protein